MRQAATGAALHRSPRVLPIQLPSALIRILSSPQQQRQRGRRSSTASTRQHRARETAAAAAAATTTVAVAGMMTSQLRVALRGARLPQRQYSASSPRSSGRASRGTVAGQLYYELHNHERGRPGNAAARTLQQPWLASVVFLQLMHLPLKLLKVAVAVPREWQPLVYTSRNNHHHSHAYTLDWQLDLSNADSGSYR